MHEANVCVLLVDAARARVMLLREREVAGSKLTELYEVADVANPRWRATDAERFADNRPGLRRESPGGPQHALGDRRDWWRRDMMRSFAQQVVEEAANIWNELPSGRVVVVADAQMLGVLRPIIARQNTGPSRREVVEVQRQLTQLSVPAVHDALAKADVLPPRGRLPPPRPMRTPNPWHGA